MCLAVPMRLSQRAEFEGTVELDGIRRKVSLMLLPDAEIGEFLLVHAGYAIGRVDAEEASKTLEYFREALALEEKAG